MSSNEEPQQEKQDNNSSPSTYYARKKNWVGGIDNDTLLGLGIGAVGIVSAVAAYPVVKGIVDNFMSRFQQQQQQFPQNYYPNGQPMPIQPQQQLPNGETYIAPTEPNANQPIQPQQQQQEIPVVEQPQQQEEQKGDENQDDDGVFYEQELKRRQKLMGQKARGRKYESPFGADVGGIR